MALALTIQRLGVRAPWFEWNSVTVKKDKGRRKKEKKEKTTTGASAVKDFIFFKLKKIQHQQITEKVESYMCT